MGMYDDLQLPLSYVRKIMGDNAFLDKVLLSLSAHTQDHKYIETQTKCLDCCLSSYKLVEDEGEFKLIRVVVEGDWVENPASITGMEFRQTGIKEVPYVHTGVINCYGGLYTDDTDYDLEVNITFVEGKVVKSELIKSELIVGAGVRAVQTKKFFADLEAKDNYSKTIKGRLTGLLASFLYYLGDGFIFTGNIVGKLSRIFATAALKIRKAERKVRYLFFKSS